MADESEDRPEYRLAIPRERLEDLIEQRAQAARRRRLVARSMVLVCLLTAGIAAAAAVMATRTILPGNGDWFGPVRPIDRGLAVHPPVDDRTAPALTADGEGQRRGTAQPRPSGDGAPDSTTQRERSAAADERARRPQLLERSPGLRAESSERLDPRPARDRPPVASRSRRASTCERLEQELARCAAPASKGSFGRRGISPAHPQAP
jgi:hypothetical protein